MVNPYVRRATREKGLDGPKVRLQRGEVDVRNSAADHQCPLLNAECSIRNIHESIFNAQRVATPNLGHWALGMWH